MGYKVRGRLHAISEAKQITDRFRKREFVVEPEDSGRYPQFIQFQLTGDRCEQLDDFRLGDDVALEFSLRGREWTSPAGEVRYFNSLDVWTIERARDENAGFDPMPTDDGAPLPADDGFADEDVPF